MWTCCASGCPLADVLGYAPSPPRAGCALWSALPDAPHSQRCSAVARVGGWRDALQPGDPSPLCWGWHCRFVECALYGAALPCPWFSIHAAAVAAASFIFFFFSLSVVSFCWLCYHVDENPQPCRHCARFCVYTHMHALHGTRGSVRQRAAASGSCSHSRHRTTQWVHREKRAAYSLCPWGGAPHHSCGGVVLVMSRVRSPPVRSRGMGGRPIGCPHARPQRVPIGRRRPTWPRGQASVWPAPGVAHVCAAPPPPSA